MPSILIIEDDLTFSLMLSAWLGKKGFEINKVTSVAAAKQAIKAADHDLILSDLRLPDGDGIELLKWIKEQNRQTPLIMMTSYAEIRTAVQAIKLGASDYIAKPLNPEDLLKKINEITVTPKVQVSHKKEKQNYIAGKSDVALQMDEYVRLVAPTDMSVLITGASGTGKEYVARRIHRQSRRKDAPFVAIDCGAIPKELAASEFFGHIKGSFTGAIENKTGAFATAQGGTVFLDEIGNLTYEIQIQLLRALQEQKIRPIGSNKETATDLRFISATNENLREAIDRGGFREDLYHRINEFTIHIPDLKERKDDILLFARYFLEQANQELHKNIADFDGETIALFNSYSWPGNIRQMKNSVKYATLLATGRQITTKDLPAEMVAEEPEPVGEVMPLRNEKQERELIEKALREAGNNKTAAARLLGIDRKTLYNKLKNYPSDT